MKKLIFATNNKGKLKEMQLLLPSIEIISLNDINWTEEIDEPFDTFHENALIKAVTIFKATQLPVLSDDSGLCIHALHGAPGVHSAYYGGHPRADQKNINKVLEELDGVTQREAYFKAVLCLIWEDQVHYFEGVVDGHIADNPMGVDGFGYDPIFIPTGYKESFAQLPLAIKNTLSHRAQAVNKLLAFLKS
ncbi:MAG: RdgB/HAM1 family non-canonical purine NTP pyrophosphatase [Bacteroidota bacterium]|nr:RdgB/HAM1 family non-canonical purine NTP pyrophosphatase [Bacteroidota bacterium]